ncbi:MAG: CPBP family intramembrane metalloprotease [Pirellulales bacterium]|nr:CPBP family intramembrane metalloprotease [Pirellulales bacterium]
MTALAGFVATSVCLTSMFCIVKLIARYRSGEPLIRQVPGSPVPWDGIIVASLFVLFLVCQGLCVAAAQQLFPVGDQAPQVVSNGSATTVITVDGSKDSDTLGYLLLANAIAMLVFTCVAAFILRMRGASWRDLGFRDPKPREGLRLACVTWVIIVPPLLALAAFLDQFVEPYSHPIIEFLQADKSVWSIALVLGAAVVAAPIAEEFFFRRILQGWLEIKFGDWAVVVSAFCFGLAHLGQGLGWVPLIGFGLAAGYLARRRGTILPSIVLHALFNGLSVLLLVVSELA